MTKRFACIILLALFLTASLPAAYVPTIDQDTGTISFEQPDQAKAWISQYMIDCCANDEGIHQRLCCWTLDIMIWLDW